MRRQHYTASALRRAFVYGFQAGQSSAREEMDRRLLQAGYEQDAIADYVTTVSELQADSVEEDLG